MLKKAPKNQEQHQDGQKHDISLKIKCYSTTRSFPTQVLLAVRISNQIAKHDQTLQDHELQGRSTSLKSTNSFNPGLRSGGSFSLLWVFCFPLLHPNNCVWCPLVPNPTTFCHCSQNFGKLSLFLSNLNISEFLG